MWFADVVVDLLWFVASRGKLAEPRGRALQDVYDPDLKTELLLYGDDGAIRHLRVTIHTDDDPTAQACVNRNIHQWINALEVSSALATSTFSTAATLQKNSAAFMVFLGQGDEHAESVQLDPQYGPPVKADFASAARLMISWKPDFKIHLHYLSRFLNHNLPPEVRWLNGYRLLEWHFHRGKGDLASDKAYRAFLDRHGAAFDAHLRPRQSRHGLLEQVRGLVAHAILSKTADPVSEGATTIRVLGTFAALESLVTQIMNEGAVEGCTFHPKA
jgi:hypothetical protein